MLAEAGVTSKRTPSSSSGSGGQKSLLNAVTEQGGDLIIACPGHEDPAQVLLDFNRTNHIGPITNGQIKL
jgi:hypothetical protein